MPEEANIIHKKVGRAFQEFVSKYPNLLLLRDPACEGKRHISLFCDSVKSRANEFCNVDMLVLNHDKIKIIVEIEESNVVFMSGMSGCHGKKNQSSHHSGILASKLKVLSSNPIGPTFA
jgi:hypothetical protein